MVHPFHLLYKCPRGFLDGRPTCVKTLGRCVKIARSPRPLVGRSSSHLQMATHNTRSGSSEPISRDVADFPCDARARRPHDVSASPLAQVLPLLPLYKGGASAQVVAEQQPFPGNSSGFLRNSPPAPPIRPPTRSHHAYKRPPGPADLDIRSPPFGVRNSSEKRQPRTCALAFACHPDADRTPVGQVLHGPGPITRQGMASRGRSIHQLTKGNPNRRSVTPRGQISRECFSRGK